MQLAGLIDDGLARPGGGRNLVGKIDQAVTATRIDAVWKKTEILEAYLNSVAFRGELVGIAAMSLTLFGKHPSGLDVQEAAVAAALLRGPNAAPDSVAQRACGVLSLQAESCVGVSMLTATALARQGGMPLGEQLAPHYARQVVAASANPAQRTTLDAALQRVGIAALRRQLSELSGAAQVDAALGASLNVPAVRVGEMLGADALAQPGGFYGSSLALGSADVSLLGLTNAYRALANGGLFAPVALRAAQPTSRPAARHTPLRVADPAAVFLVTDILADNNARARTFGLNSLLATRGFAAVKTGTSKDMRDNWCIGFTDRYTVGVWVGNAGGEAMHDVSGVSGAAPVWQTLVAHLHRSLLSVPPRAPARVVSARLQFDMQREPPRDEWFIAGTEPAPDAQRGSPVRDSAAPRFGIVSPRDGSIFALDPDMPPAAQRLRFEGEHGVWWLDGKRLGTGAAVDWAPWPGRHELRLIGRAGESLQTVHFEVRGARVKTARAPTQP